MDALFSQVEKLFGGVDILINNAGIAQQKLFTDITDADWQEMLAVNLTAPLLLLPPGPALYDSSEKGQHRQCLLDVGAHRRLL